MGGGKTARMEIGRSKPRPVVPWLVVEVEKPGPSRLVYTAVVTEHRRRTVPGCLPLCLLGALLRCPAQHLAAPLH